MQLITIHSDMRDAKQRLMMWKSIIPFIGICVIDEM